ncbi:MAG: N-acetylglucosamine-6-phosphate deacetylase [Armatimonadota bacterium]
MVASGFIDIQVNGLLGGDFSQPGLSLGDVREVTARLAERGTIAYCPTICSGSLAMYEENLGVFAEAMEDSELSGHLLGVHLEGPFISPEPGAVGAHEKEYIREPSIEDFDRLWKWSGGKIAILTLAPELPGAEELIRHASALGVRIMLGHHLANDEQMASAVAAGARGCTHLGNGLPNELHRHENPIWWQLACDDLWASFITDGHHLPADLIKVALRAKGIGRFIVTSDAAPLAGMPIGTYVEFGKKVEIEPSGRIYCAESGGLAGSHSTMFECMNHLASLDLLPEEELWQVGFSNPLAFLGRDAESLPKVQASRVEFNGEFFTKE